MMRVTRLWALRFSTAAVGMLVLGTDAFAYELKYFSGCPSGNEMRWEPPGSGVRTIPFDEKQYLPDSAWLFSLTELQDAASAAFWGYQREPNLNVELYVLASTQTPSNDPGRSGTSTGSWFDTNSNEEYWFDTQAVVADICDDAGAVGCHGYDRVTCVIPFAVNPWMQASDISVAADVWWFPEADIDGLTDCVTYGNFAEDIFVHEVGHAYGLMHNDAWLTPMNGSVNATRRCDRTNEYHALPWSDELQGLEHMYQQTANTQRNVSGTAFWLDGTDTTISIQHFASANATTWNPTARVRWTHMNVYDAITSEYEYTYRAVQDGVNPQTGTTYGISSVYDIPSGQWFEGATYPREENGSTFAFTISGVPTGQTFRVWIRLDPNGDITETDEADNWIPTRLTFQR